ncbi:HalOD1 output domain-containing protein [Haloarchaeobius sp. TZWSO28]|uniref:HalOD1 output domain-containing protein n=1 Tax=Haloarchaeobius sp. TZWSO28 TaxID=3446119 RepID=UPI003EB8CBF0
MPHSDKRISIPPGQRRAVYIYEKTVRREEPLKEMEMEMKTKNVEQTPNRYEDITRVTARVVSEVAAFKGVNADELPSLRGELGSVTLSVLHRMIRTDESLDSAVTFLYAGCCVTVETSGSVRVEACDSD